jgi:hypothetical protein
MTFLAESSAKGQSDELVGDMVRCIVNRNYRDADDLWPTLTPEQRAVALETTMDVIGDYRRALDASTAMLDAYIADLG